MLDGDLSKGQDLWSFTEVCADWLMGFRKKTKQFQGRGSDTQRWNIIWLDYWVATINNTPGPPESRRICPSPWASSLSQAARGCWCSLPSIQREWHNTLRDSIVVGQIILFLSAPTQQQSPEAQIPNSLPTRNMTITLQWTKEMRAQGGTETLLSSWTARNPAVGKLTNSSGGLNQLNTPEEKADNTSIKLHWTLAGLR